MNNSPQPISSRTIKYSIGSIKFITCRNIVATIQLKKPIKLEEAVHKLRNAEYNPKVCNYKIGIRISVLALLLSEFVNQSAQL